jgi:hypothetical protein
MSPEGLWRRQGNEANMTDGPHRSPRDRSAIPSPARSRAVSGCRRDGPRRWRFLLFVQAAWVVLIHPKSWERHGLKPWIEAAKRRLHHNVLAIALANKLSRIA